MFFEKEIVIKGNYYISLEGGLNAVTPKVPVNDVYISKMNILFSNLVRTSLHSTCYLMQFLSEQTLSVNIKEFSNFFAAFW